MSRLSRLLSVLLVSAIVCGAACRRDASPPTSGTPTSAAHPSTGSGQGGGTLTSTVRAEPQSFNGYVNRAAVTELSTWLLHAKLVRVHRVTDEVEPWLAERWTASADALEYTLRLRGGLTFSDGTPLTADDVLFSFQVMYDEKVASPIADAVKVNRVPLAVRATDPRTIVVKFPSPFGPGLRILANLPIFPRHKLEAAYTAGTFADMWTTATPPGEIVGAGPFVLSEYRKGERLVFAKNPRYWRRDDRGVQLPYLDRIVLDIMPDQDAELVRLQAGQTDMPYGAIRPSDYLPLKRLADSGQLRIEDLGIGINVDGLWFNLKRKAKPDPRSAWMQHEDFRHAISLFVNRQAFADTVYLGAAVPTFGPVSPGNRKWHSAAANTGQHDPQKARALLASLGLTDRNGDGLLEDARNQPVRFTLLIGAGNTAWDRATAFLKTELAKLGVTVDNVKLDFPVFVQRFLQGDYEATYFRGLQSDTDPTINLDYWMSDGPAHVWHMGQKAPATDWERQIDDLMRKQTVLTDQAERKRIFDEVQRIFVQHEPVIFFAAPRVYVALGSRVTNATPSVLEPPVLWNADIISVRRQASGVRRQPPSLGDVAAPPSFGEPGASGVGRQASGVRHQAAGSSRASSR